MKNPRETPLRNALRQAAALPESRSAAAFWLGFRARAALTMQAAPETPAVVGGLALSRHWALAAAALLLVLGLGYAFLRPPAAPAEIARAPVAAPPALSTIEEVEVFSEYSSVMIVEDIENGGTVIWVASAAP